MRIGSQRQWVKYLSNIRSPRELLRIKRMRKRNATANWSPNKRQSLGSMYQRELSNKPTPAELMFGQYLCDLNLFPFTFQRQILAPKMYILDFYLERHFTAFEIDGGSHKGKESKDLERDNILLKERNIKTYRFTNEQVLSDEKMTKAKIISSLTWG